MAITAGAREEQRVPALVCVDLTMGFRSPFAIEHPRYSWNSGRGDANDDSGGAGRAPREEGAAGSRVGATTATAAGERMSSPGSRALDGSRPADHTGRKPEVTAGVGPMINTQSGEARDSFLAGAAHDGDGVLRSGFQRQSRVVPPAFCAERTERGVPEF